VKVIHHGDEHLLCLSSEEVALLVDMCHAALISDHLPARRSSRLRLHRFMGELQSSLFDTAQAVWRRRWKVGGGSPRG
jgi:hypothetical protein